MTLNAALLIAVVYGLVELVEAAFPKLAALPASRQKPITIGIVLLVSVGAVFLVGASVWAHEQVIGGHPLDKLNVASKLLTALLIGGGAAGADQLLKAVSNIGQNAPEKPIAK